jgi:hypothetical protein
MFNQPSTPALAADAMRFFIPEVRKQMQNRHLLVVMLREVHAYLSKYGNLVAQPETSEGARRYIQGKMDRLQRSAYKSGQPVDMKDLLWGTAAKLTSNTQTKLLEQFHMEYNLAVYFENRDLEAIVAQVNENQFV